MSSKITYPRGSQIAIIATSVLIILTITLFFKFETATYHALRYVIGFGLIATSGYFLRPRSRLFLVDTEHLPGFRLESTGGESIERKIQHILAQCETNSDPPHGWIEAAFFGSRIVARKTNQPFEETVGTELEKRILRSLKLRAPISTNFATIHLILALFLMPFFAISMPRDGWIYYDLILLSYLIAVMWRLLMDRTQPRVTVLFPGEEIEEDDHEKHYIHRHWFDVFLERFLGRSSHRKFSGSIALWILATVSYSFGVSGTPVFWEDSGLFAIVGGIASVLGALMIAGFLAEVPRVIWQDWKRAGPSDWENKLPFENLLIVAFVSYLALCSAIRHKSEVNHGIRRTPPGDYNN